MNTFDRYLAPESQTRLTTRFGTSWARQYATPPPAACRRRSRENALGAQELAGRREALGVGDRIGAAQQAEVGVGRDEVLADAFHRPTPGLAEAARLEKGASTDPAGSARIIAVRGDARRMKRPTPVAVPPEPTPTTTASTSPAI